MKELKYLFVILSMLMALSTGRSFAAALQVEKYFTMPGTETGTTVPRGLAWDGKNLWVSDSYNNWLYELTTNGNVVSSFRPHYPIVAYGLAWDGEYLWNAFQGSESIYQLTTGGDVVSSFPSPGVAAGLTWDGTNLWVSNWQEETGRICQISTSGSVLSTITLPSSMKFPMDLAYDGTNLWLAEQNNRTIYQISTDGDILSSTHLFDDLGIGGTPYGLTWDGNSLWAGIWAINTPQGFTERIYQLKPVPVPPSVWLLGSGLIGLVGPWRRFKKYLNK